MIVQSAGKAVFLGKSVLAAQRLNRVNDRIYTTGEDPFAPSNVNDLPQARDKTGLAGHTRIATPSGPVMLEELSPGDLVTSADGTPVALRHILKTPATKTAICIRAPYYGLDQDLLVGPDHRIAVTSDLMEYLFGVETALVPVWALKDGLRAQKWDLPPRTHLYQVQLATEAALKIGRCALESMPKSGLSLGKILTQDEARCFVAEHRSGYHT